MIVCSAEVRVAPKIGGFSRVSTVGVPALTALGTDSYGLNAVRPICSSEPGCAGVLDAES